MEKKKKRSQEKYVVIYVDVNGMTSLYSDKTGYFLDSRVLFWNALLHFSELNNSFYSVWFVNQIICSVFDLFLSLLL